MFVRNKMEDSFANGTRLVSSEGKVTTGFCQVLGQRKNQEDFFSSTEIMKGVFWHAVYDGHGGNEVAEAVSETLPSCIAKHLEKVFNGRNFERNLDEVREAIIAAFHETDKSVFGSDLGGVGSTCSGVLSFPNERVLYFVQLGDSHGCLFGTDEPIIFSTKDHKPNHPLEKARIENCGGYVYEGIPARVNGTLAVSRSFGDWGLEKGSRTFHVDRGMYYQYPESCLGNGEKCLISKTPEVSYVDLSTLKEKEICLLLCSDGLTDVYKDVIIRSLLFDNDRDEEIGKFKPDPLVAHLKKMDSRLRDNTTVMIIIQKL